MKQSLEEELLGIKHEIEQARTERNQIEGYRRGLYKQLKEVWGFKTVDEATKGLNKLRKDIAELEVKLEEGLAEYHAKYNTRP
jgi:chromosome segregation ATPase